MNLILIVKGRTVTEYRVTTATLGVNKYYDGLTKSKALEFTTSSENRKIQLQPDELKRLRDAIDKFLKELEEIT